MLIRSGTKPTLTEAIPQQIGHLMTTQSTMVGPDALERAIQTVIHDLRLPKDLRTALTLYHLQEVTVPTTRERGIGIVMFINDESLDWSVEVDGCRHEHITSEVMEALIEAAVIDAESSLTKALSQRPH